jgi:hypothetical protein
MGFGPRRKVKDMRNTSVKSEDARTSSSSGPGASGMATKQNKQSGKKYDSPHYPKKDEHVKSFGGK